MRQVPTTFTRTSVIVLGFLMLVKLTVAVAISAPVDFVLTRSRAISKSCASTNGSPSSMGTSPGLSASARSFTIASASGGAK